MHNLDNLCYMLEDNIGHITARGGDISTAEMDTVYKAVKTMYYIKVMKAMEEVNDEYGYSGRRMSISYDGRPEFGNMSSYDGYSNRRMSRDGNSKEEMRRHLEMAMEMAQTEPERQNIRAMLQNMN